MKTRFALKPSPSGATSFTVRVKKSDRLLLKKFGHGSMASGVRRLLDGTRELIKKQIKQDKKSG